MTSRSLLSKSSNEVNITNESEDYYKLKFARFSVFLLEELLPYSNNKPMIVTYSNVMLGLEVEKVKMIISAYLPEKKPEITSITKSYCSTFVINYKSLPYDIKKKLKRWVEFIISIKFASEERS